jgi:2-dehydro-3-deoxygluconokinase
MQQSTPDDILNYATAAAVLKHSIPGDFALLKAQEVEALVSGHGIGKVRR